MPYRLAIDASRRLALMSFEGIVDGPEITKASSALLRKAGDGPIDLVCDLSQVVSLNLMPGDLDSLLEAKLDGPERNADPQRDVVIARREMHVLMAKFYALLAGRRGLPSHVCRTREEACAWLGVPDLPDAPIA